MSFWPLRVLRGDHGFVRFLASIKLTVVLLVAIGLACIIGTLIPQANSIGGSPESLYTFYVRRYGYYLHILFNALSFYRLYSSWWFSALLAALAINMIVCSLRRGRWRRQQVGFQLTHLSIVFLLAGVLVGLNRQEGAMQILEGEQSDTLYLGSRPIVANTFDQARELTHIATGKGGQSQMHLGFAIHLDDFELRRHHEPLDTISVQSARGGTIRSYTLAFQRKISRAAGEPWDIEIVETKPIRRETFRVVESASAAPEPAIEIETVSDGHRHTDWVFSRSPRQRRVLTDNTEIEYHRCRSREQWEHLLNEKDVPTTLTPDCIAVTWGQTAMTTLPLRLNIEQPIPGSSATLTVLQFVPHWQMDLETRRIVSASPERKNPAIQVLVREGKTSETRWLFSRNPFFHDRKDFPNTTMELRFVEAALRRWHLLRVIASGDPNERLVQRYLNGHLVETLPAEASRSMAVPGDLEVKLVRWLERATVESNEVDDPDHFAARLLLRNRDTGETKEIEAVSGEVLTQGSLHFLLDREYPIDQFISHVRVIENGGTVLTKTIQMNDPLKYRGYTFYQSSYDVQAGDTSRYTVLSASRDPGVGLVYVGFGMLTLGLVIIFYVNPWLQKTKC